MICAISISMDHYNTLGVSKTATPDEIKKAYRKLAMSHHPDRGGDASNFQKINEAYDILKDPAKRQQYDNPQHRIDMNSQNMNDIFGAFFGQRNPMRRNADVVISCKITLEDVANGKDIIGRYRLHNGSEEVANIKIPPGIDNGSTLRFKGLGDNTVSAMPRGDLLVKIIVNNHPVFERDRSHLKIRCAINVLELIIGTQVIVADIKGHQINIKIPPGTNPGTILSVPGHGLYDPDRQKNGNLYLEIKGITPKIDDYEKLEKVKKLYDEINTST
jgi:curved DNA-binding protein